MMIVIYILSGVIVLQNVIHRMERRDLYTRIMCGDIRDYKNVTQKTPISKHKEVLNNWRKGGGRQT